MCSADVIVFDSGVVSLNSLGEMGSEFLLHRGDGDLSCLMLTLRVLLGHIKTKFVLADKCLAWCTKARVSDGVRSCETTIGGWFRRVSTVIVATRSPSGGPRGLVNSPNFSLPHPLRQGVIPPPQDETNENCVPRFITTAACTQTLEIITRECSSHRSQYSSRFRLLWEQYC